MKALDVETRLEIARAAVAVLRALSISNRTMTYGELARAIGMVGRDETWEARHRTQITDLMRLIGAVERQAGSAAQTNPIEYERIVTQDGEQGAGFYKECRIVCE